MGDWPEAPAWPGLVPSLSSMHGASVGGGSQLGNPASAVWPTASLAILVPFRLTKPRIVYAMASFNGGAVSGNLDMGLYDAKGTRLVSAGSTAQAGINSLQSIAIASQPVLGPGMYYLALALDNTTGAFFRASPAVVICQLLGMAQVAAAFPLPATLAPSSVANAYLPYFGVSFRSAP